MSFVDKAVIIVSAGDGGNGKLSFRRDYTLSQVRAEVRLESMVAAVKI